MDLDNKHYLLKLLDTAGQEDFDRLRRVIYQDVSVIHNIVKSFVNFF